MNKLGTPGLLTIRISKRYQTIYLKNPAAPNFYLKIQKTSKLLLNASLVSERGNLNFIIVL